MEYRRFVPILGAFALALLLVRTLDFVVLVSALDLATPAGRVRFAALLVSRVAEPLIAFMVLSGIAVLSRDAWLLRGLGRFSIAVGAVFLVMIPFFISYGARLASAGTLPIPDIAAFRVLISRVALLLLGYGILGLLAGRGLIRSTRKPLRLTVDLRRKS